jgi:hypothetical protein
MRGTQYCRERERDMSVGCPTNRRTAVRREVQEEKALWRDSEMALGVEVRRR